MNSFHAKLSAIAKSPEQIAVMWNQIARYKDGYLSHLSAVLSAKGRTMSSMITGPARFPTASNQKKLDTEHKRSVEFTEWSDKAEKSAIKAIKESAPEAQKQDERWNSIKSHLDSSIASIIAIDKGEYKGGSRPLFVNSISGFIKRMAANGQAEDVKRTLAYVKEMQEKHGSKPIFAANNSVWQLVETVQAKEDVAAKETETIGNYKGLTIENNHPEERVQLKFDSKPNSDVRTALKSRGFHWSPTQDAWQRKNTREGIDASKSIADKFYEKSIPEPMFSLIGERGAKNIEGLIDNLTTAKAMTEAGKDKETVYLATGGELFKDGWKYDLIEPGEDMTINRKWFNKLKDGDWIKLKNILQFPKLFKAYPELESMPINIDYKGENLAYFSPSTEEITINTKRVNFEHTFRHAAALGYYIAKKIPALRNEFEGAYSSVTIEKTLLHEIQHYIQHIENFATGGSYEIGGKTEYDRIAGEVEARNAEQRRNKTPEQRKAQLISATQDVAEDQKIYLMDAIDRAYSINQPNEVQNTIDQLESTATIQSPIRLMGKADIVDYLRKNGSTQKNINSVQNTEFDAFQLKNDIFINSDAVKTKEEAIKKWLHEKLHIQINTDFSDPDIREQTFSDVYDLIGKEEIERVIPDYYLRDSHGVQAQEYFAHAVEHLVVNGNFDSKLNSEAKVYILGLVNKFTSLKNIQYAKRNSSSVQLGRTGRNANVGFDNRGTTQQDSRFSQNGEADSNRSIRQNESGGKVNDNLPNSDNRNVSNNRGEQSDTGTEGQSSRNVTPGNPLDKGTDSTVPSGIEGVGSESRSRKPIEDILSEGKKQNTTNKTIPATISIDGVDRPTTNSKGQSIHTTRKGIENFWKWFGDSKVIDAEGRPLVVYHGTTKEDDEIPFSVFDRGEFGSHFGTLEQAEKRANKFSMIKSIKTPSPFMYEVYLKIENPIYSISDTRDWEDNFELERVLHKSGSLSNDEAKSIGWNMDTNYIKTELSDLGYDGVKYDNSFEGKGKSFIIFDSNQVKSATGNNGSFSPTDNNINYSVSRNQPLLDVLKDAKDKILDKKKYIPGVTEVTETVSNFSDALSTTLSPTTKNTGSKDASESLRSNLGTMQRNLDRASARLRQAEKRFNKMSNEENTTFIDNMEHDLPQSTPELQGYSDALRKALNDARGNVQKLGTGKLENFIENYFPHYWEDSKKASSLLTGVGRRPLEGSKSFLKQRTIEFFKDGIERELTPISWNPVKLTLMKIREMERYTMAHTTINELKHLGYIKFARMGQPMPDGFVAIDDKVGTVMKVNEDSHMFELLGHHYAEENAARIINNFLSKGLRGNMVYDLYRGLGNAITQLQLGLSAFHLGFTSMDAAISKQALGWEYLYHGNVGEALKHFLLTPIAPVTNIIQGSKLRHAWMGTHGFEFMEKWFGDSNSPDMKLMAEFMEQAGGRAKMDDFYREGWMDKIRENVRNNRYMAAALEVPMQIIELTSKPILQYIVPRQKLGVFMDMVRYDLKVHPNSTPEERRTAMQKAWDSVDNRMGQLVYDNLFWNHVTKDVAMATVRSVGWNLGTFREVGGAPKEAVNVIWNAAQGKTAKNTHKLAYMISLVATTAISSAIFQFLRTGKTPEETRDYFFPKDGGIDKNGDATRVSMPSYVKDLYHYGNDFPSGAANTLKNKLSPVNGIVAQMMSNKDYYGTKIWNEDDAVIDKTKDVFSYLGQQMVPFGIRNAQKNTSDNMMDKILPFIGIVPAPYDLNMTDAEKKISDMVRAKLPIGGRTKEQTDHSKLKLELRNEYSKTKDKSSLVESLHNKDITLDEYHDIKDDSKLSPIQRNSKNLSITELFEIYKIGTPKEKELITPILRKKIRHRVIKGRLNNIEKEEIKNIKSYLQ